MRTFHQEPCTQDIADTSTPRKYLYGSERLEWMRARVIIASGIAFSSPTFWDSPGSPASTIRPICLLHFVLPLTAMTLIRPPFLRVWTWYFIVSTLPTSRAEMQFRDASCWAELPYVLSVSLMATEIPHRDYL